MRCPAASLFEGVGNEDLIAAMSRAGSRSAGSSATCSSSTRSASPGGAAPVIYVAEGQVAAAVFMENELADRRSQQLAHESRARTSARPSPDQAAPLARVALQERRAVHGARPVQLGRPVAGARAADRVLHGGAVGVAPARAPLDRRARARYPVFESRLRRALSISRERLAWVSGVKQELLDFFVRQGMSVSGEMVRVRQLDLCIDCKLCEEACEERYGARRLTLGGYQLGMLDFIYTCTHVHRSAGASIRARTTRSSSTRPGARS